jgi:hypothetical protein
MTTSHTVDPRVNPILEPDEAIDAALVGLVALQDPLAVDVDETWIQAPRWREAARALLAHRCRGGELGDLLLASGVLVESTSIFLPRTAAADCILAALDLVDVPTFVKRARERAVRLRVRRAAQALETIACAESDVIAPHVQRVRDDLARIAVDVEELGTRTTERTAA